MLDEKLTWDVFCHRSGASRGAEALPDELRSGAAATLAGHSPPNSQQLEERHYVLAILVS